MTNVRHPSVLWTTIGTDGGLPEPAAPTFVFHTDAGWFVRVLRLHFTLIKLVAARAPLPAVGDALGPVCRFSVSTGAFFEDALLLDQLIVEATAGSATLGLVVAGDVFPIFFEQSSEIDL